MRKKFVLVGAIVFILVGVIVTTILIKQSQDNRQRASEETPTSTPTPSGPTLDAEEWNFVEILNDHRESMGRGRLKVSLKLTKAAEWMSQDMATRNLLPPDHSDSTGRTFQQRMAAFSYTTPAGENIAWVGSTGQAAFNAWLASTQGHKEEMENASRTVIGIARVKATSGNNWFWTADFGGVLDEELTPTPTPTPTATPTQAPTATVAPSATPTTQITPTTQATPTLAATLTPTFTLTPIPPTHTPLPPIAKPGGITPTVGMIGGVIVLIIGGILLFIL